MKKIFVVLVGFSLLALVTGCSDSLVSDDENTSPVAQITSPTQGETYTVGDEITFAGTGTDNEEGELIDASLVWTSDVDGEIFTGESFTFDGLAACMHQITLTATDSEGANGLDTVVITVVGTVALDCDKITQILYSFGGTSGPCGPDMNMWVNINGEITTSEVEAFPIEGETDCAEPIVITGNIGTSEAADLIDAICEEYKTTEFQTEECDGGYEVIRFLHEDEELGTTGNMACSNGMGTSLDALYEIWLEVTGN